MSALLPAAASAVAGIVWARSGAAVPLLPFLIGTSFATARTTTPGFLRTSSGRARAGEALACTALVVVASFGLGYHAGSIASRRAETRLPMPPAAITAITGPITSIRGDGNEVLVQIDVRLAESAWLEADAAGPARVRASGPGAYTVGQGVRVDLRGADRWVSPAGTFGARATSISPAPRYDARVARSAGALRTRAATTAGRVAGEAAPLVSALLLGEAHALDPRVESLFRRSGTIHLLALSGMHLAVIAMLVLVVARPLLGARFAVWPAAAAAVLYLALIGARPGLVRAAILVVLSAVTGETDHRRPLAELLAATFLIQLVLQPAAVLSIGFALSYASLLGIALLAEPIARPMRRWLPAHIGAPLAAGFSAQLATAPIVLAAFGVWYPVGAVASVVMGPLVLVLMTAGLAAVGLGSAGVDVARVSVPILESVSRAVEWLGWFFSGAPQIVADGPIVVVLTTAAVATIGVGVVLLYREKPRPGWNTTGGTP